MSESGIGFPASFPFLLFSSSCSVVALIGDEWHVPVSKIFTRTNEKKIKPSIIKKYEIEAKKKGCRQSRLTQLFAFTTEHLITIQMFDFFKKLIYSIIYWKIEKLKSYSKSLSDVAKYIHRFENSYSCLNRKNRFLYAFNQSLY